MTTVPPRTSTSPRWDTLNEGFVSPARLQQWKHEHERIHSLGSSLSQTPVTSPPPSDLTATRPTPDRRNTSIDSSPNANGSPSKHKSKASFSAFFSRKTSHQEDTPPLSSAPLNRRPSTADAALQSQQNSSSLSPPPSQVNNNANTNAPIAARFAQQQQPPPPQQQEPSPGPPQNAPPQPQQPPLHPEIRSVVQLTLAHAHKVYFSGPLVRRIERQPDGQKPAKDEGWREVWAQLGGTTLSVWDMEEIQEASKQGRQVPPSYINVTDAFVHVLGSIALPPTPGAPQRRYTNVLTLNTAGSNLYLFSCPSAEALVQWTAAIRLAAWEKSRLEEIYTAHLIRITLNDGRTTPSPLANGRLEGWVRIRIAGQTDWKRQWMVISAGSNLGHPDRGSISSLGHGERPASPDAPRNRRLSNLFSRDKATSAQNLPARPLIQIYNGPRSKDKKKSLLTMRSVTQAFAVYPERPELISRSTLMKLEGQLGDEEMAGALKMREAWLLVMPELEGNNTRASEMLRWIIAIHDAFELYGRPRMYSWDPRDSQSMMFAYPIGPHRDLLFLDREFAETLDVRDDRTSAIRAQFLRILSDRMSGVGPSGAAGATGPSSSSQPPTLPPLPSIPTDDSQQGQSQQPQSNGTSLQLPPFSFDSTLITPEARSAEDRRPLSTITERSTPLEGRSLSTDKTNGTKTQQGSFNSPPPLPEVGIAAGTGILEQPLVSSPTTSSPPPEQNILGRRSIDSYANVPTSRPDSKLSQRPGQMASVPSQSSSSHPSSPTPPPHDNARQARSPEPRPTTPSTPPRFATNPPRAFPPPRASSPLRATSPPQTQQQPVTSAHAGPPPTSIRMVPDRSISQASIPTSLYSIPTPTSRGSYNNEPAPAIPSLHSPTLQPPPLQQTTTPAHEKKSSLTDDILGDAGAALFYMQHMQQEGAPPPPRKRGPPPPTDVQGDDEEEESPSDSESEPYTPPPRHAASPLRIQHGNTPPPSASPQPPVVPAKSPKPQARVADQGSAPAPTTEGQASSAPRPGSGLRNRPSGARAAPATRMSAYLQNSPSLPTTPSTATTNTSTSEKADDRTAMAAAHENASYEDHNADALAALTFLEQEDRPAPAPPRPPQSPPQMVPSISKPQSPSLPEVVETPASPSSKPRSAARSSFAPTRLAAERKAKSQAQQAAQQAAAHRPGKANGRRAQRKNSGAWGDSSEEEEEDEEEEDEDVDSDEEPPLRSAASVSDHNSAVAQNGQRSPYAQAGAASPARSAVDVNNGAYPPPRRPRDLPQTPGGQYPDEYLGAQPQPRRLVSESFTADGGRRSLYPGESTSRGSSPQYGQPGPQGMRPQSQFPAQGQFAQQQQAGPQRPIWSQVLDPDRHVEPTNQRDTFIQMEAPATTMTKAFTPHGLLSAGMQDKQDRSAKRQEELARESGASLINVPNKPPPPQTGLLGAVTAHERERKREGGLGAALTEREREKRVVEERQRKLDEFQRQQLDQMQQGGSMYGGGMMGFNPMMANPMMLNPMMTGGWGYPGMMPGFANPQQLFAAQQAAAQAYQQAMVAFSTAGSQIGGGGDGPSPGPMNPMMTGNSMMGMGGFDPRMSMMGMPMMGGGMGGGMGMNPMGMNQTGSGMGGMGMNPMMAGGYGGGGMGTQMTGMSQFDPRLSPGLEGAGGAGGGQRQQGESGTPTGPRQFSNPSSPGPSSAAHPPSSPAAGGANGSSSNASSGGPAQ